jgi:hypothetical protein
MMFAAAVLSRLHDAELSALSIDRTKRIVTLDFVCPGDVIRQLTFYGVVGFRIVDLIQQNVVSRIVLSGDRSLSDDDVYKWVKWVNTIAGSEVFIQKAEADNLVTRIKAGNLSLLVLEPSWGAELAVVFEKLVETTL